MWKVEIIESERGWGQKLDSIKEFKTQPEAVEYMVNFNKENNLSYVPDWYMYAKEPYYVG